MVDNRLVNNLVEAIDNATGDIREQARIGKLLVNCQTKCRFWSRSTACQKHDGPDWIDLLLRPGRTCEHRGPMPG